MNTSEENIGGIDFLESHKNIYLPYTIFYIIGVIIGCTGTYRNIFIIFIFLKIFPSITGNLLIMAAILMTKELQSATYMLIFNLGKQKIRDVSVKLVFKIFSFYNKAIADFTISVIVDSFTVVGELFF